MHLRFPSITSFKDVYVSQTRHTEPRALTYGAKIKLHGTNIGVRVSPEGAVSTQGRNIAITAEDDHHNCHQELITPNLHLWKQAKHSDEPVVFYGEWAGPGIAKGDAIQQTDRKRFYIFAAGIGEAPHHQDETKMTAKWMITCPNAISALLPEGLTGDLIRVLPWENEESIIYDFTDKAQIEEQLEFLNRSVEMVAEIDPFVSRVFDIKHPGEGFVVAPVADAPGQLSVEAYSRQAFKAKTERHRVKKTPKPASVKEPLPTSAVEFIDAFCTEARLQQALQEVCGGEADIRKTGAMIAWMTKDIEKEGSDEIAALPVPFARIQGDISQAVRNWFLPLAEALP